MKIDPIFLVVGVILVAAIWFWRTRRRSDTEKYAEEVVDEYLSPDSPGYVFVVRKNQPTQLSDRIVGPYSARWSKNFVGDVEISWGASLAEVESILRRDFDPNIRRIHNLGDYPLFVSDAMRSVSTRSSETNYIPILAKDVPNGALLDGLDTASLFARWKGRAAVSRERRLVLSS